MAQKFKFRYVNEIVGGFVILVVILLAVGIFFAANGQKWFQPMTRFRIQFPADGSYGLKEGGQVQLLGTVVGRVEKIEVADDGSMEGKISVNGDFSRFVREGSEAVIRKTLVVTGDAFVEVTRGTGGRLEEWAFLPCRRDREITETIQTSLEEIQLQAQDVMEQARVTLKVYADLGERLGSPDGDVMLLVASLKKIAAGLAAGEGPAGAVLRDPELATSLRRVVSDLEALSGRVNAASEQLAGVVEILAAEADHLPGSLLQARETLRESEQLLEALQRHWLISSYVEPEAEPGLIPPGAVGLDSGGKQ